MLLIFCTELKLFTRCKQYQSSLFLKEYCVTKAGELKNSRTTTSDSVKEKADDILYTVKTNYIWVPQLRSKKHSFAKSKEWKFIEHIPNSRGLMHKEKCFIWGLSDIEYSLQI